MTDEVLPRRLPHDPNSFGAGLMRSAIEQGFPSVGGKQDDVEAARRAKLDERVRAFAMHPYSEDLYREDMDHGDVEAMAGEYVAMAIAIERLRGERDTLKSEVERVSAEKEIAQRNAHTMHEWSQAADRERDALKAEVERLRAVSDEPPAWTREAPEDPGFYWWRFVGHKQAETVELDGWGQMRRFADDREWEMAYGASGEFWPVRLEPPAS